MADRTVYVALQGTTACGCNNHRMCLEHYLAAQKFLGDPRDSVTVMAALPNEYSDNKEKK